MNAGGTLKADVVGIHLVPSIVILCPGGQWNPRFVMFGGGFDKLCGKIERFGGIIKSLEEQCLTPAALLIRPRQHSCLPVDGLRNTSDLSQQFCPDAPGVIGGLGLNEKVSQCCPVLLIDLVFGFLFIVAVSLLPM